MDLHFFVNIKSLDSIPFLQYTNVLEMFLYRMRNDRYLICNKLGGVIHADGAITKRYGCRYEGKG